MNLFKMAENYRALSVNEDLDPEAIKDTLDALSDSIEVKVDNIATWIDKNKRDIDFYKSKMESLSAEKKRLTALNDRLNAYVTDALDQAIIKKINTDNHIVIVRNYRAKTIITDKDLIPDRYKTTVTDIKVDANDIYKDLMRGADVDGAYLKPNRKAIIK